MNICIGNKYDVVALPTEFSAVTQLKAPSGQGTKFSLSSRKLNAAIVHCCCDYCECMPMDIHWRGRDRLWPGNMGEVVISCCQQQEVLSLG